MLVGVFDKQGDTRSQAKSDSFYAMPVVKRVLSKGDPAQP